MACREKAERQFTALEALKTPHTVVLGPNPAFLPKLAGRYRYQIILKIKNEAGISPKLRTALTEAVSAGWTVDVDPDNLL